MIYLGFQDQFRTLFTKAAFMGVLFGCTAALATEPLPAQVTMNAKIEGKVLVVELENREPFVATVSLSPGRLASLQFREEKIRLNPGQKEELKLAFTEMGRGLQVLHIQTQVTDEQQRLHVGPQLHQPFQLSEREPKKLTFEEAYLNRRESIAGKSKVASIDLGGVRYVSEINRLAFKANEIPNEIKIQALQFRPLLEYTKMPLKQLPKELGFSEGQRREIFPIVVGPHFDSSENSESNGAVSSLLSEDSSRLDSESSLVSPDFSAPNFNSMTNVVKGHMSLKMAATTYKAAWGWVVRAWQDVGGNWVFLGWTYVGGDGSWEISLPGVVPSIPVRIEYQTKNRFVSLQDASGNPYTWGDNWKVNGAVTDIGYRYADLSANGDLPGIDTLYEGATNLWEKFYNTGMNALRDQPIQVTYPNTLASGQCVENTGSGPFAWSCSYWSDGKIYIIPEHAYASVVQHEIAHSINSYYWSGHLPSGAGGMHDLTHCYNNGLALTEGFADFISYWVEFDRTNSAPVAPYFGMNIESIPDGVCANQTAEMRVAATFWDLYDVPNDGPNANDSDSLYCTNQASPVAMYLDNSRNSMSDYLAVIQSGQSSYWQGKLADLFRLNKIIN